MGCFNNIHNEEAGVHYVFTPIDPNRPHSTHSENTNKMVVHDVRSVNDREVYAFRPPGLWNTINKEARQIENKAIT